MVAVYFSYTSNHGKECQTLNGGTYTDYNNLRARGI